MFRNESVETTGHVDNHDIERSFSSQNIHQDFVHLIIEQQSLSNMLRMPTVEEELFEELLNLKKRPICICGRALRPIKQRFVGLYCHTYEDDDDNGTTLYPNCSECNVKFGPSQNAETGDDDTIWLCPSKQLYPHLFGYFLCKTCCVEQVDFLSKHPFN